MSDDAVRAQYEAYPYPQRDPREEAKRLIVGSPSHFDEIVHYVFGGRAPTTGGRKFRALVAGGGTGDAAIMLAQQLADRNAQAEVVHLDISRASRRVAQARAKARRLRNIRFVHASLFELGEQAPGPFDYIDCCGVLHHLEDPAAGLRALAAALADGGGMGVMLYGAYGRTGVYHVRDALRMIGGDADSADDRLTLTKQLLDALPQSNWLARNPWIADHLRGGDAGLFDLLLHARDRAYTVPEVLQLAAAAGLAVTAFIEPVRYDPAAVLGSAAVAERAAGLSWADSCALAELVAGNMKRHVFYAVKAAPGRAEGAVAAPGDAEETIPVLRQAEGERLAREVAARGSLRIGLEGTLFTPRFDKLAPAILSRIDGRRSLSEIHAAFSAPCEWSEFHAAFDDLYGKLNGLNVLLLRRPAAPAG